MVSTYCNDNKTPKKIFYWFEINSINIILFYSSAENIVKISQNSTKYGKGIGSKKQLPESLSAKNGFSGMI